MTLKGEKMKRKNDQNGPSGKKILFFILFAMCIDDVHAKAITTRTECLQYIANHRPVCIRKVTPYEVCACGIDEQDFQNNIRGEEVSPPPPLDYSECVETDGILYCPESIFGDTLNKKEIYNE